MERYRSGHNGPDSKSGSPQGLVGSNPTRSAKENPRGEYLPGGFNKKGRRLPSFKTCLWHGSLWSVSPWAAFAAHGEQR